MIKTIIFDIGGVLIGYDWTAYLMKEFNGDEELVERIKENVFGEHKWDEVDRGVLSDEELLAWENEHKELLMEKAPEKFEVRHYAALAMLKKK